MMNSRRIYKYSFFVILCSEVSVVLGFILVYYDGLLKRNFKRILFVDKKVF